MDNQNKGGQQNTTEDQDLNKQKKPQGTDANQGRDQQNQAGNPSGNQAGKGNQAGQDDQKDKQGERKSA